MSPEDEKRIKELLAEVKDIFESNKIYESSLIIRDIGLELQQIVERNTNVTK